MPEFDEDRLEDAIQIRQHFLVPNSHYTISACRNYSGPLVILSYACRIGVFRTVEFYNEAAIPAARIDAEVANRKLTAELETI